MVIQYDALPAQFHFLRSRAQFAGLFGGIGSGKSHAGCFWALLKALRNPHCLGLIAANTYRQLKDASLRTFEALLGKYKVGYRFSRSADLSFRLDNGAEILCRSMDCYDMLRGVELGWFYLDELRDTRLEAWQVVKGRLRSRKADALEGRVTSSPHGFDWIYEEFVRKPSDPATAAAYANHEAFFARTQDNRHLPPDYVAALLASYDPLLAEQELEGRFVNATQGRIYHAFDRAAHVGPEAELAAGRPLALALDFNVTPLTAVIVQYDPGRGIRVIDEIWLTHSSTLAMCETFAEWLEDHGLASPFPPPEGRARGARSARGERSRAPRLPSFVPLEIYGDATGSARSTVGTSDYAILRDLFPRASLCVASSNPSRRDRYNAVNAAFRDARGRVRLRIHPRCRHLIEDLERTTYQAGSGEPDHSDPLRGHISDALGYLVARVMPAGRAALVIGRW